MRSADDDDVEAAGAAPLLQAGGSTTPPLPAGLAHLAGAEYSPACAAKEAEEEEEEEAEAAGDAHAVEPLTAAKLAVFLGATLVAAMSNTTSGINVLSDKLRADTGTSLLYISVLQGLGVAGLQLTLPVGRLVDRVGPLRTVGMCGTAVVGGYLLMSWAESPWLVLPAFTLVGFASGGTFVASLQTAIAVAHPLGIAMVSVGMSLSISLTVAVTGAYEKKSGCRADECWRDTVRVYAACAGGAFALGSLGLLVYERSLGATKRELREVAAAGRAGLVAADERRAAEDAIHRRSIVHTPSSRQLMSDRRRPVALASSVRAVRTAFFGVFFYANLVGVGSGLVVVTQAKQLWDDFNDDPAVAGWNKSITTFFSVATATANVLAPMVAQWLLSRRLARRKSTLAALLGLQACLFLALGAVVAAAPDGGGSMANRRLFASLMSLAGIGFGTSLVMFPQTVGAEFPVKDFGTYLGFMQLGSGTFAVAVPSLATFVHNAAGSYNSIYFAFGALLLLAALLVARVELPSERKAREAARIYSDGA